MRLLLLAALVAAACGTPPSPTESMSDADALLSRSLDFHDPNGQWYARAHRMELHEKRPDGSMRRTELMLDPLLPSFGMRQERGEDVVETYLDDDNCSATVNGTSPDSTLSARYRLTCPDGPSWWREYYAFMHGLPMKLRDSGTRIEPAVMDTTFMGRDAQRIRVTYDSDVGADIWYFYFDPETAELIGSRFYHDEAARDGEYILHDGTVEADGMRLTRTIRWYTNAEDRFLGADSLALYEVAQAGN